jgi:hypothetical protein
MTFLISISKLNALAMWAQEEVLNELLALSRLIAAAFSHSLGTKRNFAGRRHRQDRQGRFSGTCKY